MKTTTRHGQFIKRKAVRTAVAAMLLSGCGTFSESQKGALLVGAETLANIAGTAAATYYGGPAAGQMASAGLSALGSVLEGYVGAKVPSTVVQATPGVANVGAAVAGLIAPDRTVKQSDVDAINAAAALVKSLPVTISGTNAVSAAQSGRDVRQSQRLDAVNHPTRQGCNSALLDSADGLPVFSREGAKPRSSRDFCLRIIATYFPSPGAILSQPGTPHYFAPSRLRVNPLPHPPIPLNISDLGSLPGGDGGFPIRH